MRIPLLKSLAAALICGTMACDLGAQSVSEERLELLFRPWVGERTALSTDGRYLAYTQHLGGDLTISVMDLETLKRKTRIVADEDRPLLHSKEKGRARLRFMDWADGNRLVFAPSIERIAAAGRSPDGDFIAMAAEAGGFVPPPVPTKTTVIAPIMAVDADGANPLELLNGKTFDRAMTGDNISMRAPFLLGFATGENRGQLLAGVRGNGTETPTEVFRVDVRTGARKRVYSGLGPGRSFFDRQGQGRLNDATDPREPTAYLFRAGEAKRWEKLPDPAPGLSFVPSEKTYYGERALPLGFDYESNVLIYAANVGRDTFGVYALNLQTRQRTPLALEHPTRDLAALNASFPSSALVFDRARERFVGVRAQGPRPLTVWLDPELAEVQREVDGRFPRESVEVLEWNDQRTRFLLRLTGGAQPRRIVLYRRPERGMDELLRSAPWLVGADLHETSFVEFEGPDGSTLSGYLTLPRAPRLNPPPLIVWFADGLPPVAHPEFDPQALALADMGFMIFRLNQRGILGLGTRNREALRKDPDGAPAADAAAAVDWLAARHRIDRKRIVALGAGFGGYLAVRATEIKPELFRCAAVFDPIFNFGMWLHPLPDAPVPARGGQRAAFIEDRPESFQERVTRVYLEGGGAKLNQLTLAAHSSELNVPVFVAARLPRDDKEAAIAAGVSRLKVDLKLRGIPCVTMDYDEDYAQGQPAARARVYRELEEFFNLNLYNYDVRIGPTRVVK